MQRRYSTDNSQCIQAKKYPLLHARWLLCSTPSAQLVVGPVDLDIFCDILATVFRTASDGIDKRLCWRKQ